jgi:hypothetical protein
LFIAQFQLNIGIASGIIAASSNWLGRDIGRLCRDSKAEPAANDKIE